MNHTCCGTNLNIVHLATNIGLLYCLDNSHGTLAFWLLQYLQS